MTLSARTHRVLFVLVLLALPALSALRFDRHDHLLSAWTAGGEDAGQNLSDARFYTDMVRWFRGEPTREALTAPFAFRPLAPALASLLPAPPLTALNILNLLCLFAAALLIHATARRLAASRQAALSVVALFVFSFPAFYYSTIGYVDPVLIAFLCACVFAIARESTGVAAGSLILGVLAKEAMIAALPAYVLSRLAGRGGAGRWVRAGAGVVVTIASLLAARTVIPAVADRTPGLSIDWIAMNAVRPRAWISIALTLVVPAGLTALLVADRQRRRRLVGHPAGPALIAGAVATLALVPFGFASAHADGRLAWAAYPFLLPVLALLMSPEVEREAGRPGTRPR